MHPVLSATDQRVARAVGAGADKAAILATGPLRSRVDIAVETTGPATLVVEQRRRTPRQVTPTALYDEFAYDAAAYGGDSVPPVREVDRVTYQSATTAFEQYDLAGEVVRAYLTANHGTVEAVARGL
jgi:hypothetical protein